MDEQPAAPARHLHLVQSPLERWRHTVEIVALIAAGLWGFYVFIYENRIKPAGEPINMPITVQAQKIGNYGGLTAVRVRRLVRNAGKTHVFFLTARIEMRGVVWKRGSSTPSASELQSTFRRNVASPASDVVYRRSEVLLRSDPRSQHGMSLDPGGTIDSETTYFVDTAGYNALIITQAYAVTKDEGAPLRFTLDSRTGTITPPAIAACDRSTARKCPYELDDESTTIPI